MRTLNTQESGRFVLSVDRWRKYSNYFIKDNHIALFFY